MQTSFHQTSFPVTVDLVPKALVRLKLSVLCLRPKLSVSVKSDLSLIVTQLVKVFFFSLWFGFACEPV